MSEGGNGKLLNSDEILAELKNILQVPEGKYIIDHAKSLMDDNIKISELIIGARRTEGNNIETLINTNTRTELEVSLMRLTHHCYGIFNAMSMAAHKAQESKIIKPKGSIIDFVRRKR